MSTRVAEGMLGGQEECGVGGWVECEVGRSVGWVGRVWDGWVKRGVGERSVGWVG